MHGTTRLERWLFGTALVVGRSVTQAITKLPRVVSRASGVEEPSTAAATAGIIRAVSSLGPVSLGPVAGSCVDVAGGAAVLALATWTVRTRVGAQAFPMVLRGAIADVEARGICDVSVASAWRAAIRFANPALAPSENSVRPSRIVWRLARHGLGLVGLGSFVRLLRVAEVASSASYAWSAMGKAASLISAMERFATKSIEDQLVLCNVNEEPFYTAPVSEAAPSAVMLDVPFAA